jgi:hypothetical protein
MRTYRSAIHSGRLPLGAHVAGTEAHRVIARLLIDGWTKAELAAQLGHRRRRLQYAAVVTLRTTLALRRLHRQLST